MQAKKRFTILMLLIFGLILNQAATAPIAASPDAPATADGLAAMAQGGLAPWQMTGSLTTARLGHSDTLLPDGRVLAIAAGGDATADLAEGSIEAYDPVGGTWQALTSMRPPRRNHTATLLPDGQVLIAGGDGGMGEPFAGPALLFEPGTNGLNASGALQTPRSWHTATLMPDGSVLAVGGGNPGFLSSIERWTAATGQWRKIGDLATAREFHSTTLLPDGTLLVVGGAGSGGRVASIERVAADGSVTPMGNLISPRGFHSATLLQDGRVLVAGGDGGGGTGFPPRAEIIDPGKAAVIETGPMLEPRRQHDAVLLGDGRVLVVAGDRNSPLAHTELYDPVSDTWSEGPPLNEARRHHSTTLLDDGSVLVAGGWGAGGRLASSERTSVEQQDEAFVAGQVLVMFEAGMSEAAIGAFYTEWSVDEIENLAKSPRYVGPAMRLLQVERGAEQRIAEAMSEDDRVASAELNTVIRIEQTNDPLLPGLWAMPKIQAPAAWNAYSGEVLGNDKEPVIFVIDTGIDYTHNDLHESVAVTNIWNNPDEVGGSPNFDDDNNGYIDDLHGIRTIGTGLGTGDPMDTGSHGTHVAGTIGAIGNNAVGVAGVAWIAGPKIGGCAFLNVNSGTTADAIECFNYVNDLREYQGVDVVVTNNSWGGGGFSSLLETAMKGPPSMAPILHVAAAGNNGWDIDLPLQSQYPASYNLANILAVANTDQGDVYSPSSNWGKVSVDIAAPGTSINSTVPGSSYGFKSGTSMASPHIAGCAVMIYKRLVELTSAMPSADYVKAAILSTGDDIKNVGSNASKPTVTNDRLNCFLALTPKVRVDDTEIAWSGPFPDDGTEPNLNPGGYAIWASRAIWVRNATGLSGVGDTAATHQNPIFGQNNAVWVHVQNDGLSTAKNVTVEVFRSQLNTAAGWSNAWVSIGSTQADIPPGGRNVEVLWYSPQLPTAGHYCLIARIHSAEDPIKFPDPNGTWIGTNTLNNNNIAWRNVSIVKKSWPSDNDATTILVGNVFPEDQVMDLSFDVRDGFLRDGGEIVVDLGPLFRIWQGGGARGENVTPMRGTMAKLTGSPARVSGIPLRALETATIRLGIEADEPMPGADASRVYDLDVVETLNGREIGGVRVSIETRAQGTDTDGDGLRDVEDPDDDNDGVADGVDADPIDPEIGTIGPARCYIDLSDGLHNCEGIEAVQFLDPVADGDTLVKLDLNPARTGFERASFSVEYEDEPTGYSVNIGDSISNDGNGGDAGDQSNSAEMQISGTTLAVFGNDHGSSAGQQLAAIEDAVGAGRNIVLDVANRALDWTLPSGRDGLRSDQLFALAGQPDNKGEVNHDIFASFNRSIGNASRKGSGVGTVEITLWPPPYAPPGHLTNISTRGWVGVDDEVLIGGFILADAPASVIIRAIGPDLTRRGVPGALQDPWLEVYNSKGEVVARCENWRTCTGAGDLGGLAPTDDREAALKLDLDPGAYTAIVRGERRTTGVALVEVFHAGGEGLLSNISTRGKVRVDDEVMIGGFILRDRPAEVIIRAIGPDLARRGVPGALQDPWLEVYNSKGEVVARCENWRTCAGAGELGALAPTDDREAALKLSLEPGAYTAIVRGEGRSTGIALVEVFRLR